MRIAVFTGSHSGPPSHQRAAATFATDLARAGVGIVYGGGNVGLMGVVADAALAAGGEVVGVIPQHLVGLHSKPTAFLDVEGFWQPQLDQLRRMVDDGYLAANRLAALGVVHDAAGLLAFVEGYTHPARKWSPPAA